MITASKAKLFENLVDKWLAILLKSSGCDKTKEIEKLMDECMSWKKQLKRKAVYGCQLDVGGFIEFLRSQSANILYKKEEADKLNKAWSSIENITSKER